MRKLLIGAGILLATLGFIFIVARWTNMLQFYRIPFNSNYPSLKAGSYVWAGSWIKPKRFDHICYYHRDSTGRNVYVYRLCGMPGDIIEIRDGILLLNGRNADTGLTLAHNYIIPLAACQSLQSRDLIDENSILQQTGDSVLLRLEDALAREIPKAIRYGQPAAYNDDWIKSVYGRDWNADRFGPIRVPAGKLFVLGDNRNDAADSRYSGFANQSDVIGVVIR